MLAKPTVKTADNEVLVKRSRMRVSFRIRHPAYFGLRFGLVVRGSLSAKGFPLCAPLFREFDTLYATPTLAAFGQYLTHLFDWMMGAAVVAESGFRHQFFD
jgi:hypothetical protein